MNKTLVFTGGHHNSALAVADALIEKGGYSVIWYGHKYSMRGDRSISAEFQEVTQRNIKFRVLTTGKVYRTFNPLEYLKVFYGLISAYWALVRDRPRLIVSFGGYLAVPVVLAGWLQGVPIITHEQTTVVGLANRVISFFADQILITWPQSKRFFKADKVKIVGLPLRSAIFQYNPATRFFNNELPTLYITGGKQGSHIINEAFYPILPNLLKSFNVIFQTGANMVYRDYERYEKLSHELPDELRERFIKKKYFFEEEVGQVFYEADLLVSRAGAHTIYEIAALGQPAILIPIPWVSHNEQDKNARKIVNEGAGIIISENRLTAELIEKEIYRMMGDITKYQNNAAQLKEKIVLNAKERMIREIEDFLQAKETR